MTIGGTPRQLLQLGNLNNIADAIGKGGVGDGLMLIPRFVAGAVASNVMVLPNDKKAVAILSCFVTAGTTLGFKTPVATGTTPTTGQVAVNPSGDIVFASADAVTAIELVYVKMEQGALITETLTVASNIASFLQGRKGITLVSATLTGGLGTGVAALVQPRAASVTNTTKFVCLNATGTGIICAATDAVTSITVTYIAQPGVGSGVVPAFATRMDTVVSGTPTV